MSIINSILDLALKKNINAIDPNNYGDSSLNALSNKVTTALAGVDKSEQSVDFGYGITIPGPAQLISSPTGCVVVGDATYYCAGTAGNSCSWTVPAGATMATFQIWGAGGNTSGCCHGNCCAIGYWGGSGEYKFVKMRVTPGQTYTLCAGGACPVGSCYTYQDAFGCNSFVCGSNSTCILSCGGFPGCYSSSCVNYTGDMPYPDSVFGCGVWSSNYQAQWFQNYLMCQGQFSRPGARYQGQCQGGFTTNNTVIAVGQAPSFVGTWYRCTTTDYAYMYSCTPPIVLCNHTVVRKNYGNGNGYWGGCEFDSSSCYNLPGMGGTPTNWACYSSGSVYGGRGRSGLVIVKYC